MENQNKVSTIEFQRKVAELKKKLYKSRSRNQKDAHDYIQILEHQLRDRDKSKNPKFMIFESKENKLALVSTSTYDSDVIAEFDLRLIKNTYRYRNSNLVIKKVSDPTI